MTLLGVLSAGVQALSVPAYAFLDRPTALVVGDGYTSFSFFVDDDGASLSVCRGVGCRLEIGMHASGRSLFDPYAKLLVVRDWMPANVSVQCQADRWLVLSTWRLGPVQVDLGRAWGRSGGRWCAVSFSLSQRVTLVGGIEQRADVYGPIVGVRLYPGRTRRWGGSVSFGSSGVRLTVGGSL